MRTLLDFYVMRQIATAAAIVALTLTGVILMTQSLRFLELIIESGASGLAFVTLSLLALPRFFEVIFPIALTCGGLFVYQRLQKDGEVMVMQTSGMTPFQIARPGLVVSVMVALLMFVIMAWVAPLTLAHMNQLRQVIKAQVSSLMFREGVFNSLGSDVTVYIADRGGHGGLSGIMIYDARPSNPRPVTVMARQGTLVMTSHGDQVIVYKGARQSFNPETKAVERLNFDRYIIDLPDAGPVRQRWAEPEERTFFQLFHPAADDQEAQQKRNEFLVEIHRRIVSPFLAPSLFVVMFCLMQLFPEGRARAGLGLVSGLAFVLVVQGGYIAMFSLARSHLWAIALMYLAVLAPLAAGLFWLRRQSGEHGSLLTPVQRLRRLGAR